MSYLPWMQGSLRLGQEPVAANGQVGDRRLDQYFTPEWAAELLVERFFPAIGSRCAVDAGCGRGAFLKALPSETMAIGVEIDPALAAAARSNTGRDVLCGDFRTLELPFQPDYVLGNPPFRSDVAKGFLGRALELVPDGGAVGFVLPTSALSFASTVERWRQSCSIRQEALPRDLFPRIRVPLSFYLFTKDFQRRLFGFALFEEAQDVRQLPKRLRLVLTAERPVRRTWSAVVEEAMQMLGGEADLDALYSAVEPNRHTQNRLWRDTVRRELQEGPYLQVSRGRWRHTEMN